MPDQLNVLLIGGGGREHAIARKLSESPRLGRLWITHPENPGLASLGRPVDVPVSAREIYRLQQFCEKNAIGLVVVGPEEPLAEGFADKLAAPGRLVFGPTADAARLEADKAWAKQLMRSASIPTAEARVFGDPEQARFYCETREQDDPVLNALFEEASRYTDPAIRRKFIERRKTEAREVAAAYAAHRPDLPVIKASGLAKGKGVIVPSSINDAFAAIESVMVRRVFGDAGRQVVVEERLAGPEVSVLAIVDGRNILVLPPCQDHKRLGDNDTGPNTGGMGAFCPAPLLDEATLAQVEREILVPTIDALRREGIEYRGVLYAGIMLTPAGPKVLEFNCRFGDPECQPLMTLLESDLIELLTAAATGRLDEIDVRWRDGAACCVVLAAHGYPDKPRKGDEITGLAEAQNLPDVRVYHAGTKTERDRVVTAGGRVLGVTGVGPSLEAARAAAYRACDVIRFEGKILRRDIGAAASRLALR